MYVAYSNIETWHIILTRDMFQHLETTLDEKKHIHYLDLLSKNPPKKPNKIFLTYFPK